VQAWFPLGGTIAAPISRLDPVALRFHELRTPALPASLQGVYNELVLRMDSAFIEYCLRYPFDGDKPIDYAPFTEEQVKDSLFALGTHAFGAVLPRGCPSSRGRVPPRFARPQRRERVDGRALR
jgi:hypothetical protein